MLGWAPVLYSFEKDLFKSLSQLLTMLFICPQWYCRFSSYILHTGIIVYKCFFTFCSSLFLSSECFPLVQKAFILIYSNLFLLALFNINEMFVKTNIMKIFPYIALRMLLGDLGPYLNFNTFWIGNYECCKIMAQCHWMSCFPNTNDWRNYFPIYIFWELRSKSVLCVWMNFF